MDVLMLQNAKHTSQKSLFSASMKCVSVSPAYSLNVESVQICVYVINYYILAF